MSDALAVVVAKPETEAVLASLREEGIYDDTRKVREYNAALVELPVTEPPSQTPVRDVVRQSNPEPRAPDLETLLDARGWTPAELEHAPGSWAVIGSVVVVSFDEHCPRREEVGEVLLTLHGEAHTVLAHSGVSGPHREPDVSVVAGDGDTETVHTEHGTEYALDLSEVMFSPGNQAERARMGDVVDENERVFDMFAGIGYFTLPMARAGATVVAAEHNPNAFRYLLENAVLNGVQDRVEAFRADCRDVDAAADRVVMGYYGVSEPQSDGSRTRSDEAYEYLDTAFDALDSGGMLHMHEATPESRLWDRPVDRLETAAADRGCDVEIVDRRKVKSHSEGVWHVALDVRVT